MKKTKYGYAGIKIEETEEHCVMCGKVLDTDTDHENSCRECE